MLDIRNVNRNCNTALQSSIWNADDRKCFCKFKIIKSVMVLISGINWLTQKKKIKLIKTSFFNNSSKINVNNLNQETKFVLAQLTPTNKNKITLTYNKTGKIKFPSNSKLKIKMRCLKSLKNWDLYPPSCDSHMYLRFWIPPLLAIYSFIWVIPNSACLQTSRSAISERSWLSIQSFSLN